MTISFLSVAFAGTGAEISPAMAKCTRAPWQLVRQLGDTQQLRKSGSPFTLADNKAQQFFFPAFSSQTQLSIREGNGGWCLIFKNAGLDTKGKLGLEAASSLTPMLSAGVHRLPPVGWH